MTTAERFHVGTLPVSGKLSIKLSKSRKPSIAKIKLDVPVYAVHGNDGTVNFETGDISSCVATALEDLATSIREEGNA